MRNYNRIFTAIIRGNEDEVRRAIANRHLQLVRICHQSHGECVTVIEGPRAVVHDWESETLGKYPGDIVWVREGSSSTNNNP